MIDKPLGDRISSAQIRLRSRHPFFATLLMFADFKVSQTVETAATDGKSIYFNEEFANSLLPDELDGVLIHEVLHMALMHCSRRLSREAMRWNIACDIVINGMIKEANLVLPMGAIFDDQLCSLSAEDIYERLPESRHKNLKIKIDLMETYRAMSADELRSYWSNASAQASVVTDRAIDLGRFTGVNPYGASREWREVKEPEIDWRTILWSFMVRTPTDYVGFDRRFVGQGLYLDAFDGESISTFVCVDTSGSVGDEELSSFLVELRSIMSSYPQIVCELYFADVELYGPFQLDEQTDMPSPQGGGGTSFSEFFRAVTYRIDIGDFDCERSLAIYMTDGYAPFPDKPKFPVLWVLTSDGIDSETVPYGSVAKLRHD